MERGGDVIPKIVKVVDDQDHPRGTRSFAFPIHCPECGGKVVRAEGEADHRCVNAKCPAKLRESLLHFASRNVMNIEGMGESLVNQLADHQMVKDAADIYSLSEEKLLSLERIGKKSAQNLLREIDNSRQLPLQRPLSVLFAGGLLLAVVFFVAQSPNAITGGHGSFNAELAHGNVQAFGHQLFTAFFFPFELTAPLLIVAMIGAVAVGRRRPGNDA